MDAKSHLVHNSQLDEEAVMEKLDLLLEKQKHVEEQLTRVLTLQHVADNTMTQLSRDVSNVGQDVESSLKILRHEGSGVKVHPPSLKRSLPDPPADRVGSRSETDDHQPHPWFADDVGVDSEVFHIVSRSHSSQASQASGSVKLSGASRRSKLQMTRSGTVASHFSSPSTTRDFGGLDENQRAPIGFLEQWPASLELRDHLLELETSGGSKEWTLDPNQSMSPSELNTKLNTQLSLDDLHESSYFWTRGHGWVKDPNSGIRMFHDACGLVLIFYDMIVLPYTIAFDVAQEGWIDVVHWISLIFWTWDLPLNFFTGFFEAGELQMEMRPIAKHYLSTWFCVDFLILFADWASMFVKQKSKPNGSRHIALNLSRVRILKLGRVARLFRIFRMLRSHALLDDMMNTQASRKIASVIYLAKIIIMILWISHAITCIWYGITRWDSDTGGNWDDLSTGIGDLKFHTASNLYTYISGYHWSVSQVTGAGSIENLFPTNTLECIFNIVCCLFGLLFGSSVVSMLSSTMIQMMDLKKEQTQQLEKLRRFLRQNEVHPRTAIRVQKMATERIYRQKPLLEYDVEALSIISSSLRVQLRFENFRTFLVSHPFFRFWSSVDKHALADLCTGTGGVNPVEMVFLNAGDDVMTTATKAEHASVVIKGVLKYETMLKERGDQISFEAFQTRMRSARSSNVTQLSLFRDGDDEAHESTHVLSGKWICEAALWSHWYHVGTLEATSKCQLATVSVQWFSEVVSTHNDVKGMSVEYGRLFYHRLITAKPPQSDYPNDIEVPFAEYTDLVPAMEDKSQLMIGLVAIRRMRKECSFSPSSQQLDKLDTEVRNKMCTVVHLGVGQVLRVVSLIALRLERLDGLVLVKLAKWNGQTAEPDCVLPGKKYEQGLTPQESLKGLLSGKLECFVGGDDVTVLHTERVVQTRDSKDYGVATKYVKTIVVAHLTHPDRQAPKDPAVEIDVDSHAPEGLMGALDRRQGFTIFDPSGDRPVYYLPNDADKAGKGTFYAYIKYEELEFFNSPEGERSLYDWVARLDVRFMQGSIPDSAGFFGRRNGRATLRVAAFRKPKDEEVRASSMCDLDANRWNVRKTMSDMFIKAKQSSALIRTASSAGSRSSSATPRSGGSRSSTPTPISVVQSSSVDSSTSLRQKCVNTKKNSVRFADSVDSQDISLITSQQRLPPEPLQESPPPVRVSAASQASEAFDAALSYANGQEGADNGMEQEELHQFPSSDRFRFGEEESTEQEKVFTFA